MMKKCATCGWWFEPSNGRQKFCDDECRKEAQRMSLRRAKEQKKVADQKKRATLKIRPDKLPKPPRAPTREYRGRDSGGSQIAEYMGSNGKREEA